jgi:hypothetical protein
VKGQSAFENYLAQEQPNRIAEFEAVGRKYFSRLFLEICLDACPNRPIDPDARTNVVDEEQGIVISFGNVNGVVAPILIPIRPSSRLFLLLYGGAPVA